MMNIPSIPFTRLAPLALEKLGFLEGRKAKIFRLVTRLARSYLVIDGCFPENSGFSPQIIHGLIGFSIINHPFWGFSPYFWKHPDGVITAIWGGS